MEPNTSFNTSYDRYIPLRGSSCDSFKVAHKCPRPSYISCQDYCRKFHKNDSEVNFMQYYYKKNQYKDLLVKTMFQSPRRVLYFSPEQKEKSEITKNSVVSDWPVKARKKPLITSPEIIMDISDLDTICNGPRQKLDWGSTGFLAGIQNEYSLEIHNPDNHIRFTIPSLNHKIGSCLKWIEEGSHLAVGLKKGGLMIWDVQQRKMVHQNSLRTTDIPVKETTCIEYSLSFLITCHKKGVIQVWTHDMILICCLTNAHKGTIISAKISCDERHFATIGVDSYLKIWTLPDCKNLTQIYCDDGSIITSIDWHPWKASMLAVGKTSRKSFCTLWDMNKPSDIQIENHPNDAKVDCISFNPISAELVVSVWLDCPAANSKLLQSIVVQSNCNTVVDDINFHSVRTLYTLWDKEGKRLATVGADDCLAITNFFGREAKSEFQPFKKDTSMFRTGIIR